MGLKLMDKHLTKQQIARLTTDEIMCEKCGKTFHVTESGTLVCCHIKMSLQAQRRFYHKEYAIEFTGKREVIEEALAKLRVTRTKNNERSKILNQDKKHLINRRIWESKT